MARRPKTRISLWVETDLLAGVQDLYPARTLSQALRQAMHQALATKIEAATHARVAEMPAQQPPNCTPEKNA